MPADASIESKLAELVLSATQTLALDVPLPPVALEIPRSRSHGDLSCSVAMQLAGPAKQAPLKLAESIAKNLAVKLQSSDLKDQIEQVQVKPPGFINFQLTQGYLHDLLSLILERGSDYGRTQLSPAPKAHLEFVSANPTGPLSVAHGRQAAVGDALANLMAFAGHQVTREYYVNDEGTQIDLLGESILARARELAGESANFPENGYKGAYVAEAAQVWLEENGSKIFQSDQAQAQATQFGVERLLKAIEQDLDHFGVRFDAWFRQSALKEKKFLEKSLDLLKKKGTLFEEAGAWWLKSTDFGDDKDRVVIRADGRLTYIASDIAYHRRKFDQKFDQVINLWGPDHHGYIARLKAAVQALGFDPEKLQIRLIQMCTLKRGEETIKMSTREGEFVTLAQVIDEVGRDATRFFFLLRKMDAHLEFDLELAKKHSLENPVYYIQYAHARISNILEKLKAEGIQLEAPQRKQFDQLTTPEELELLRLMREFPGVIASAARQLEPFSVITFLQALAESLHRFYDRHRVIDVEPQLASARLGLIQGVQTVLATGLRLLGVSAPEKM